MRIIDVEIIRLNTNGSITPSAVLYVRLPKKYRHAEFIEQLAGVDGVNLVEEL